MAETKEELYTRVRIGGRVGFGRKPAILVIDVQKAFTDPESAMSSDLDEVVKNTVELINVAKGRDVPIIYTVVAYMLDLADGGLWGLKNPGLKMITMGSRWAELDDRLPYEAGKDFFIIKKMASAFFGTSLICILQYHGVDTVVAVGDSTSGCVRSTVQDGLFYGYSMIVPRECVGDRCSEAHEANLFDINAKLADVVSMEEVISYLNGFNKN